MAKPAKKAAPPPASPVPLPGTVSGASTGPFGRAWLITFTDLVALMLTFFVLLFSMSQIEQPRWQNLVDAFATQLDQPHETEVALPQAELDVNPLERIPATDLDYLDLILREKLQAESRLGSTRLWCQRDRIILSLPASRLFAPGSDEFSEDAEGRLFALGGLLYRIDNRIEVVGHALPGTGVGGPVAASDLSLMRALAVAGMLNRGGYAAELAIRGHGAAGRLPADLRLAERAQLEERIDIVIFADRAS